MKKTLLMIIFLLVLAACVNEDAQPMEQETEVANTFETISLDSITSYVDDGYLVVDVREIDEYESGHIPDAIHAPLSALQNEDFSRLDKENKYIIICRSGNRSTTASNILSDAGFDIVNVSEGMSTWTGDIETSHSSAN